MVSKNFLNTSLHSCTASSGSKEGTFIWNCMYKGEEWTLCWPSKGWRCIPDVVLKNEGSMVQTWGNINVHGLCKKADPLINVDSS